jgi:predicted nucleic acid-binding protein
MPLRYALDTSAILTHFLDEPGAELVDEILSKGKKGAFLPLPVWAELERRLEELIADAVEAELVWSRYTQELCGIVPLDEAAIRSAMELRKSSPDRLPLIDALIAGCAKANELPLVHRDAHLAAISESTLRAVVLPAKR